MSHAWAIHMRYVYWMDQNSVKNSIRPKILESAQANLWKFIFSQIRGWNFSKSELATEIGNIDFLVEKFSQKSVKNAAFLWNSLNLKWVTFEVLLSVQANLYL